MTADGALADEARDDDVRAADLGVEAAVDGRISPPLGEFWDGGGGLTCRTEVDLTEFGRVVRREEMGLIAASSGRNLTSSPGS